MKKRYLSMLIFLMPVMVACMQEDACEPVAPERVKVVLQIEPNEMQTYANVNPDPSECLVENVYIWFFHESASDSDAAVGYYSLQNPPAPNVYSIYAFQPLLSEFGLPDPTGSYEYYLMANLPDGTEVPPSNVSKAELKAWKETQFVRTLNDRGISFFFTDQLLSDFSVYAILRRTVARVDLQCINAGLSGWSFAGVEVENEQLTTAYITGQPSSGERTTGVMLANGVDKYRYYLYENPAGTVAEMIRLKVKMTDASQNVSYYYLLLNQAENGLIERNNVYNVQLTVKPDDYVY